MNGKKEKKSRKEKYNVYKLYYKERENWHVFSTRYFENVVCLVLANIHICAFCASSREHYIYIYIFIGNRFFQV